MGKPAIETKLERFNFRLVLGAVVAVPVAGGLFAMVTDLAKTDDLVLEHSRWIRFGIYFLAAAIWAAIVFLPRGE